ncbi:hypothetical protein ACO2Q3_20185 [Caulobacter sp. KR2-114]|uniref:hypothetical protein n=1 Tax=Caulobacter sp. KR2-114 TaxID=3400912 RepID=UPI003C0DBA83
MVAEVALETGGARTPARALAPARALLVALAWAGAMVFCLRYILLSGFDLGYSDRGDGVIEIALLEHWRNVFQGTEDWRAPLFFHPWGDGLGYNDGYFLYGVVYSLARTVFDPFISDTVNAVVFKTIGFFSAFALFRGPLAWSFDRALLAAVLFSIANSLGLQIGHAQLETLALTPLMAILVCRGWQAGAAGRRLAASLWGVAAAVLMAAWLITAYYFAWFSAYFAGFFLLFWLRETGQLNPRAMLGLARRAAPMLIAPAAVFAVACIPFLMVYLPKVAETGAHPFNDAQQYLTMIYDPVNSGPGNIFWGWIARGLGAVIKHKYSLGEHESGLPLLQFALLAVALRQLLKTPRAASRPLLKALAWTILVTWALTLQFGPVSPWRLIYWFAPGARGLRTVVRYQIFLTLPVLVLVFAHYADRWARLRQAQPWLAAGLATLLLVENVNFESPANLSRTVELAQIRAIPAPPAACKVFSVAKASATEGVYANPKTNALYPHNVDAMLLSELWRMPTVNGFSTFNPPDWNFADPSRPDYPARVRAYGERHDLHGLCLLDMRQPQPWSLVRP